MRCVSKQDHPLWCPKLRPLWNVVSNPGDRGSGDALSSFSVCRSGWMALKALEKENMLLTMPPLLFRWEWAHCTIHPSMRQVSKLKRVENIFHLLAKQLVFLAPTWYVISEVVKARRVFFSILALSSSCTFLQQTKAEEMLGSTELQDPWTYAVRARSFALV